MVPIEQALFELSSLSAQLNEETEALNEIIAGVERQLADAKLGVSIWLTEAYDSLLAGVEVPDRKQKGWVLGFVKLGNAWRIAAHPAERYWWDDYDADNNGYYLIELKGEPVALAAAPRIVRVDAAGHLERLVKALSEKAKGFIGSVAKALSFVGAETPTGGRSDDSKIN
jgi:hypothetical protein